MPTPRSPTTSCPERLAFLQDITLGRYVALDSPIHRLDPRTKLIAVVVLMIVALSARDFGSLATFAAFLLLVIALSRLSYRLVLGNLKPFIFLFSFTFGLHALMTPGRAVWLVPFSEHAVTAEGLRLGAFFTARLCTVIVAASLLTLTTSPMELTGGLERLFRPLQRFGFPAGDLAMMISIALRFIPVLVDEAERLRKAQLARGADFGGRNPLKRIKSLVPLLVPLFVAAFDRADRLALAMESRCYQTGAPRSQYRTLRLQAADGLAALAALGLIALMVYQR